MATIDKTHAGKRYLLQRNTVAVHVPVSGIIDEVTDTFFNITWDSGASGWNKIEDWNVIQELDKRVFMRPNPLPPSIWPSKPNDFVLYCNKDGRDNSYQPFYNVPPESMLYEEGPYAKERT